MVHPQFNYCYYDFGPARNHRLRIWVTPSLNLEWVLYVDDVEIGRLLDTTVNPLITSELNTALSYQNVIRVYNDLIKSKEKP